jgi:ketosteroid isomerase-like protein
MSTENVEIVRSFYRAWARNDLPGPAELMDPEIEYVNPIRAVEPGTRRGLAAFSRAVEKVFEGWESWEIELEQLRPVGDHVAVVMRYRTRVHGSTADVAAHGRPCGQSATAGSCAMPGFMNQRTPSKPPGCGGSRFGRKAALCMETRALDEAQRLRTTRAGLLHHVRPRVRVTNWL